MASMDESLSTGRLGEIELGWLSSGRVGMDASVRAQTRGTEAFCPGHARKTMCNLAENRRILTFALLLFGACLGGCATIRMPQLAVPAVDNVDRIVVFEKSLEPNPRQFVIEDRDQIARIVGYLSEHNQHWHQPWDTFPVGDYSVLLKHGDQTALFVWIGEGWIGGHVGGEARLRNISRDESQRFRKMLGIPSDDEDP